MAFLDVWISNQDGKLALKTYRKPTHTELYIKWQSFVPLKHKINLVRNLLHRAYKICNSYLLIHEDFKIISTMLEKNGYPTGFLNQQIRIFFNKMHEKVKTPEVEEKPDSESKTRPIFSILKLPYIGDMSHQIEKEIRQYLFKKLSQKSKFVMVHETTTIGQKFRYKDRQTLLHSSGVVYKLNCSCGQSYIGQTKRNLKIRINDHMPKNSTKNETDVSQHLKNNPDHTMNFHSPEILAHSNNIRKLRIKETLLIQNLQPQLNIDDSSNPIYLFNI